MGVLINSLFRDYLSATQNTWTVTKWFHVICLNIICELRILKSQTRYDAIHTHAHMYARTCINTQRQIQSLFIIFYLVVYLFRFISIFIDTCIHRYMDRYTYIHTYMDRYTCIHPLMDDCLHIPTHMQKLFKMSIHVIFIMRSDKTSVLSHAWKPNNFALM